MSGIDWDDVEAEIDRTLQQNGVGEGFLCVPQKRRPNKNPIKDPERPEIEVCGIFTRHHRLDDFNPSALSSRGLKFTDLAQRDPVLEIIACDLPYQVVQGDVFVRHRNGVEYEVTDPQANGHGILFLKLVERGISGNAP